MHQIQMLYTSNGLCFHLKYGMVMLLTILNYLKGLTLFTRLKSFLTTRARRYPANVEHTEHTALIVMPNSTPTGASSGLKVGNKIRMLRDHDELVRDEIYTIELYEDEYGSYLIANMHIFDALRCVYNTYPVPTDCWEKVHGLKLRRKCVANT